MPKLWLLSKFPSLDLTWPDDIQDRWWRCFWRLLELANGEVA